MGQMTIAALARAGGVGVETVRYYQRRGLLPEPPRPPGSGLSGGVRRYGDEAVRQLRFIRAAQVAGFTLEEIRELLALDATDDRARARAIVVALDLHRPLSLTILISFRLDPTSINSDTKLCHGGKHTHTSQNIDDT